MTYEQPRTYRLELGTLNTASVLARLMNPSTRAVELDVDMFIGLQRGDALQFVYRDVRKTRRVTWTLPVLDRDGRVASVVAGLGDTLDGEDAS